MILAGLNDTKFVVADIENGGRGPTDDLLQRRFDIGTIGFLFSSY